MNHLDKIAELWAQGLTTAVIGKRLGIPKNSVCRLAFHARRNGDARFPARAFAPVRKPKPKPKLIMRPPMPRRKLPPPPLKPRAMPPLIWELKPHECRYPVSAFDVARDEHRFCAKPQTEGSAYCAEHRVLCNPPMKPRVHR